MNNILDNTLGSLKRSLRRKHAKLGVTYTAVSTSDDSSSGAVVSGLVNASNLAEQLLASMPAPRCCAIAIANGSGYRLMSPQSHASAGTVRSAPFVLEHGFTGLVGAEKANFSARGCAGVLTYELDSNSRLQLQIMWSVPDNFRLFDAWVNVAVGESVAGEDLFKDMYKGRHGEVVRARDTCRVARITPNIRGEVVMSDGGRSTLVVKLFRN